MCMWMCLREAVCMHVWGCVSVHVYLCVCVGEGWGGGGWELERYTNQEDESAAYRSVVMVASSCTGDGCPHWQIATVWSDNIAKSTSSISTGVGREGSGRECEGMKGGREWEWMKGGKERVGGDEGRGREWREGEMEEYGNSGREYWVPTLGILVCTS